VKRYTFTCVLSYGDEVDDPERYVNMALTYGDKHQDYVLWADGEIKVEDQDPED
jgi:hypothetical protein